MMELARVIGEIATGERNDATGPAPDAAAAKRGNARADALTPLERQEIARKGGLQKAANRRKEK